MNDRDSGIPITTASAICAVLDMLSEDALPQSGLIEKEELALRPLLANRFGHSRWRQPRTRPEA